MKNLIALLLAVVMCLSLVACSGSEKPNSGTQQETQENTRPLTPTINNGANETISPPEVPGENAQRITVEITPENWSDYFELVEEIVYHTDDFGDFSSVNNFWRLALKKGYTFWHGSNRLQFEVQYNLQKVNVEIKQDTQKVIKIDGNYDTLTKTDKVATSGDWALITQTFIESHELGNPDQQYIYYISDFQVLRVAGGKDIVLELIPE